MTGKLVLENLKHRPMRSLLSILLIGVPVTLILCLVGLSRGFIEDSQRRARGVGADVLIRPKGSSMLSLGYSMPAALVDYFHQQPHVQIATGVLNATVEGVTLGASGVDPKVFAEMSGGFLFRSGGTFQGPDDVIIDDYYAEQKKYRVGDKVKMLNHEWRVSGIMESGKLSHIIVPLATMQEVKGEAGKVSQIYLKLDNPANTKIVIDALNHDPRLGGDYPIYPMEEYTSLLSVNNIPGLKPFTYVIVGIGVVIGFAVVCLSMYMAVLQRTREIGILKSLGGSKGFILRIILAEALMLGVGGTILGIIMSYGAYWLIRTLVPASFPMIIVHAWWPIAGAITLVATGLGALYPGLSAAAHDPIEALAYE
ncbi:MAG TPA: ABC transporter permease [Verrucomicrobiae bacterium]|nr:ABC transporter permease [Verrucomicrobiae bacterium]